METVLSSFNRELYERNLKEEAAEEALEKGRAEGRAESAPIIVDTCQKLGASKEEVLEQLVKLFQDKDVAERYLKENWEE